MDLFEKTKKSKHVSDRIFTIFIGKRAHKKLLGIIFNSKSYTHFILFYWLKVDGRNEENQKESHIKQLEKLRKIEEIEQIIHDK